MLDLETLSTKTHAAVISIGVCAFDQDQKVIASEGWAIRAADWHGHVDPKTVKWWMEQNEAARNYSFSGTTSSLDAALAYKNFVDQWGGDELWANDPDFDVTILKHWWERVQEHHRFILGDFPGGPLRHRLPRSYRTIVAEAKRLGISTDHVFSPSSVAHNPVDDACNQARVVVHIRNHITAATP